MTISEEWKLGAAIIHHQIIVHGGYPKSTQVVQALIRKPDHELGLPHAVQTELLKKRNFERAMRSLGFEIETRQVVGLEGASRLLSVEYKSAHE